MLLDDLSSVADAVLRAYVFIARPGLIVLPLLVTAVAFLFGHWQNVQPPKKVNALLFVEHVVLGWPLSALLAFVTTLLARFVGDTTQLLPVGWWFLGFAFTLSVLGYGADVLLFRFGDPDNAKCILRCIRWRFVLANAVIVASMWLGVGFLRAGLFAPTAVSAAAGALSMGWYCYRRPTPGSRVLQLQSNATGRQGMAVASLVISALAFLVARQLLVNSSSVLGHEQAYVNASLFGILFGGTILSLAGIIIAGMNAVISATWVKMAVAVVTGAAAQMTAFSAAAATMVEDSARLVVILQATPVVFAALAMYLLVAHLAGSRVSLRAGDIVQDRSPVRRPSDLMHRGRDHVRAAFTDEDFMLADFVVACIYESPGKCGSYVAARQGEVRDCAAQYREHLPREALMPQLDKVTSELLMPGWVIEHLDRYALTAFALRAWQRPADPKALDFIKKYWRKKKAEKPAPPKGAPGVSTPAPA